MKQIPNIEETNTEIDKLDALLIDLLNRYNLQDAHLRNIPGTPITTIEGKKIKEYFHQQLQKARESELKRLIAYGVSIKAGNIKDVLAEIETRIKYYHSELDQPTLEDKEVAEAYQKGQQLGKESVVSHMIVEFGLPFERTKTTPKE